MIILSKIYAFHLVINWVHIWHQKGKQPEKQHKIVNNKRKMQNSHNKVQIFKKKNTVRGHLLLCYQKLVLCHANFIFFPPLSPSISEFVTLERYILLCYDFFFYY